MSNTTIVVLSDPNAGEEALGRVFNALAAAYDFKTRQQPVQIVFQGTGTRWPRVLSAPDHPAHALYRAVADTIAGASAGCSAVFDARDSIEQAGLQFISDNAVPGTPGLPSLAQYASQGSILTF